MDTHTYSSTRVLDSKASSTTGVWNRSPLIRRSFTTAMSQSVAWRPHLCHRTIWSRVSRIFFSTIDIAFSLIGISWPAHCNLLNSILSIGIVEPGSAASSTDTFATHCFWSEPMVMLPTIMHYKVYPYSCSPKSRHVLHFLLRLHTQKNGKLLRLTPPQQFNWWKYFL